MKVCLCSSPHLDHNFYYQIRPTDSRVAALPFAPLGLLSMAACLEQRNTAVDIIDLNRLINDTALDSADFYTKLATEIGRHSPDVLGFMTDADSYHHTLAISQECKKLMPGTRIVLGGPHASVVDQDTLTAFDFIDFVVRGEGEVSMAELTDVLRTDQCPSSVKGISYRAESGAIIRNDDRPLIKDLDSLPLPAFHLYDPMPRQSIYVEAGRGCPYSCTFCFTAPYWKRQYRVKSPQRLISELKLLNARYSLPHFHLVHDLFTTNKEWVETFCNELMASGLEVTWTCSSRTDTVNDQLLDLMGRAGCTGIYYGLETGSGEMQKAVRKCLDLRAALGTIQQTMSHGIEVTAGIMLGFPGESEDAVRSSLELFSSLLRIGVPKLTVFRVCPFRGSEMYEKNRDALYFDGHFLDFPLHRAVQAENFALMMKHPTIFSGYYRYRTGLNDETFLKGIDELSPIMGLLRYPILAVLAGGVDELQFLRRWAGWIHDRNVAEHPGASLTAYGTVDDFLTFLKTFIPPGESGNYVSELIQYETTKNDLRKSLERSPTESKSQLLVKRFAFDMKDVVDRLVSDRDGDIEREECYVLFLVDKAGELATAKIRV